MLLLGCVRLGGPCDTYPGTGGTRFDAAYPGDLMTHFPYMGSRPVLFTNSFAMMFGAHAPSTAVIEFATGSPFGMQLIGGTLPFFDPCMAGTRKPASTARWQHSAGPRR